MLTKDGRDTPIAMLTAENYIVPAGEEKDYHAVIEVVKYDSKTGRKISKPRVQKFGRKTFEQVVLKTLRKQGFEVKILHDPNEWLKANQAKIAEMRAEAARQRKAAEAAKFSAAVAAAVEAELAKRESKGRKKKED